MKNGKYSCEEDNFIINLRRQEKSNFEIAKKLKRNLSSVKSRIKSLIRKNKVKPRFKKRDIKFLQR